MLSGAKQTLPMTGDERLPHRRSVVIVCAGAGVAALALGVGLTHLIERYISPDHALEARTRAMLWIVRVRWVALGAGALLAGWAFRASSFCEWLRRLNVHPRSWAIVAGLIFAYAAVSLYLDPYLVSALYPPTPDACEYAVSARQLMVTGSYTIPVGEGAFPPRYPFGYPLLIVPFYWVFGAQLSNAVLCSLALVSLAAALVYRIGERVWGRKAGVVAALLTLSSSAVIDASRWVMSESAATLGAVLVAWHLVRLLERERPAWMWGLSGACVGAGAVVRFSNIVLLAPVALVLLRLYGGRLRRLIATLAWVCAGCGAALAPLLIYQAEAFGGMFRTGYSFWVAYYYDVPGNVFRLSNVFRSDVLLSYGSLLTGWYSYCYAVPTAVFAAVGSVFALRRPRGVGGGGLTMCLRSPSPGFSPQGSTLKTQIVFFVLCAAAVMVLFYALYYFSDRRFLTPVAPLLMLPAGAGIAATVDLRPSGWRRAGTVLCNLLCLWTAADGLVAVGAGNALYPWQYEVARLIARRTELNAIIVSGINPLFLQITAGRQVLPVSRRVEYASKIVLPRPIREAVPEEVAHDMGRYTAWALERGARRPMELVATEAPDRIVQYMAEGRPVYCDDYDLRGDNAHLLGDDLPLRARFRFEPVDSVSWVHLYRLRMP